MSKFILRSCKAKTEIRTDILDDGLNTERKEVRSVVTLYFVGSGDFSHLEVLKELERELYVSSKLWGINKEIEL